jgi:hypothetical protein
MVVAISDEKARSSLGDLWEHGKLVGIGRGYRDAADHPRPANPHMHPKAVEGLFEESVLAESSLPFEALAAMGSGEGARWQGHRVADGKRGVVRSELKELLPEELLGLPEVCCLPGEGGAMHPPQVREEVGIVAPEVGKELRVLVEPQELAYDLDGQDLRVEERRSRSTLSEASELSDAVVYEAEDAYDEGAKIHESGDLLLASVGLGTTERREVSLFIQQFGETCTRG